MAEERKVVETVETDGSTRDATVAERVVYYVGGIIIVLLTFRFILSLLGANRGNAFADFVYDLSFPFVAPFFGLFGYTMQYGISRLELETMVAILVYAVVTGLVAQLFAITRR